MEGSIANKLFGKLHAIGIDSGCFNKLLNINQDLEDNLPDGSCFSRVLKVESVPEFNKEFTLRKCEYVGSFLVTGNNQTERSEFVKEQLAQMQVTDHKQSVLLAISSTGIKVFSLDEKMLLMAHALKRISFATCDPDRCQFSFLAREPNGQFNIQYCHSFLTKDAKAAEEVSGVVGSAFRLAFAQQLHHSESAPAASRRTALLLSPAALLATCSNAVQPTHKASWAKNLVGRTNHCDPLASQAIELRNQAFSSNISGISDLPGPSMNNSMANRSRPFRPNNLQVDWAASASGGCSSSEENNSPPDVNSCKQVRDKPPMLKNLEVMKKGNDLSDDGRDGSRSLPGFINDDSACKGACAPKSYTNSKSDGFSALRKLALGGRSQIPSAPLTDEESLLGSFTARSSMRSSRSSCDRSFPSSTSSLSDGGVLNSHVDLSSSIRGKRVSLSGSACSNTSITPPPPPERYDSLNVTITEELELRNAAWFQAGVPREIAIEHLEMQPVGAFMVRKSTSKPGCFALSLRVPREFQLAGIAHYLIMRTNRGYKIKGFTKEFSTLKALITHHSVMPELLPCPLSKAQFNPTYKKQDSEDLVDVDADPDYNMLSDFRRILEDNVQASPCTAGRM